MPLKVLIVPDKFKGTLTAQAAAQAIAEGWCELRPNDGLELLPMSDGGDGFGEVMSALISAEARTVQTLDAAHRPHQARWWWDPGSGTAIVESANVIGLALLPLGKYHPFELDTAGLGVVIRAAASAGARRIVLGIGGSATNDCGFGLARALGWTFLDARSHPIASWSSMDRLTQIIPPSTLLDLPEIHVAVDVQNPLLGPTGASRIYGPQKGLRSEDMPRAESCLERLAEICTRDLKLVPASVPGDGAAGGLGFGLRCFLKGWLESGFKLFANYARLEERVGSAQLVITGEGAIDNSTLMGKGVGEIAKLCQRNGVPCLGLAGTLGGNLRGAQSTEPFKCLCGIAPTLTDPEEAKRNAASWLRRLAAESARSWPTA
jgi:glycerate kinase